MLLFQKFLFLLVTLLLPLLLSSLIAAISRFAVKDPDATLTNPGGTTGEPTMKAVINNSNVDANSKCVPLLANRESRDAEFAMQLRMTHSTPLPSRPTTPTMTVVTASCSKIALTLPSFLLPHRSSPSLPFQVAVKIAITLARTSVPSTL